MTTWTDKDLKIDVSYNKSKQYVCVEHPALVQNPDKAIHTLGGIKQLEKIYSDPLKRLPLQWRPDDFYCKPAYGDRASVSNLLMKVRKRTRKSDGKEEFQIEVLGIVETTFKFQSMVDFQYLPIRLNEDSSYESVYEKVRLNRLVNLKDYLSAEVPLYMPPLAFARVDKPVEFHYKQEMRHREEYKNPDSDRPPNLIGTVRQRRSIFTIFVNFGEKVPTGPIPEALERTKSDFVDQTYGKALEKIFEEQPLYLKTEIEHKTGLRGDKLKIFLPAMCFYWLDGPWRGQWNKFGFNPTTDSSAKIYQTIDFRIRQVRPGQIEVKAKRDILKLHQFNQVYRNQKHNVKISLKSLEDNHEEPKQEDPVEKELYYKFKPDTIPPQRMMYYPVCHVLLTEVQTLLHENDGKEEKCTEKDGWCVEEFNSRCRDIMYSYLNNLLGAKDTVDFKFWRTKKKKRRLGLDDPEDEDGELEGDTSRDLIDDTTAGSADIVESDLAEIAVETRTSKLVLDSNKPSTSRGGGIGGDEDIDADPDYEPMDEDSEND